MRSAEGAFRDHAREVFDREVGSAAKRQAQAEAAVTRAMPDPRLSGKGVGAIRRSAKVAIRTVERKVFEKLRDTYLLLDLFPEQRERYSSRFEDCLPSERRS